MRKLANGHASRALCSKFSCYRKLKFNRMFKKTTRGYFSMLTPYMYHRMVSPFSCLHSCTPMFLVFTAPKNDMLRMVAKFVTVMDKYDAQRMVKTSTITSHRKEHRSISSRLFVVFLVQFYGVDTSTSRTSSQQARR